MIERLDISQGQRHLDIASGTGEPGLSISKLAANAVAALQQVDEPARERIRATAIANVARSERATARCGCPASRAASWERSSAEVQATTTAARAVRWSLPQGGPNVARGSCRTSSARAPST